MIGPSQSRPKLPGIAKRRWPLGSPSANTPTLRSAASSEFGQRRSEEATTLADERTAKFFAQNLG